jgi:hypothetical protein
MRTRFWLLDVTSRATATCSLVSAYGTITHILYVITKVSEGQYHYINYGILIDCSLHPEW